jgi:hypothetical protein
MYNAPYGVVLQGVAAYGTTFYIASPASAQTWAPSPYTEWVFDNGATTHLSKDAGILYSLSPHPVHHHVTIGDGSSVPVSSSNHASLIAHFIRFIIQNANFVSSLYTTL